HPFYQAWTQGSLPLASLQSYAGEYKDFIDLFPRLVSRVHSQCSDVAARKLLLENLAEEEGYPAGDDHPELWRRFAQGVGVSAEDYGQGARLQSSCDLSQIFWQACDKSYEEGLAALYAYE